MISFLKNILYVFAIILVVFWAIGYFIFDASSTIHVLLVLAVIACVMRLYAGSSN